jgi:hypothetical protein
MDARMRQRGTTTVEFAIVGAVLLTVIFAVMEFGRIVFTLNMLQEGARRAARVAVVCAVDNAAVTDAAVFMTLPGLTNSNVVVEYLGQGGAPLADPAGANYSLIRYVRVRIVDYSFPIAIPFITPTFDAPEFSSTLPRESLGIPNFGAAPAC